MAEETIREVTKSHKSKKSKKSPVLVGIHVRRGDHLSYEDARDIPNLKASYFLQAMDKYR